MALEDTQAARRIRYLTPVNAGKVLGNGRYWTVPFLRRYLERADIALRSRAEDGFLYAVHGPELARRVQVGGSGGFENEREKQSYALVALGILGAAAHSFGELTKAQVSFAEGKLLLDAQVLLPGFVARFLWRLAAFEHALGHSDDSSLARATQLPQHEVSPVDRGRLALVKGQIACMEGRGGGEELAEALLCAGTHRRGVLADLRDDVLTASLSVVRERALPLFAHHGLMQAIVHVRKSGVYSLPKRDAIRLLWIEGYIHYAQGLGRYGVRVLERAGKWIAELPDTEAELLAQDIKAAQAAEDT